MDKRIEYLQMLFSESKNIQKTDHRGAESLRTSAYSTLSSVFGSGSIYCRQLENFMHGYAGAFIDEYYAILKSALRDLEHGALLKTENFIILGTFDNLLNQAKELNKGGEEGKKPAGVLTSAVFEDFLSRLCIINGFEVPNTAQGKINLLATNSIINAIQKKRFETIREMRNSALHAQWEGFSNADVGRSIKDLEDLMSQLLAN